MPPHANPAEIINEQTVDFKTFKAVIVGDAGAGKTTFVKRHLAGLRGKWFERNLGVDVYPLDFATSAGNFRFACLDTAGREMFGRLRDEYYRGAKCAIIMFDVSNSLAHTNVRTWYCEIRRVCGDIPIVVCGNKADLMINLNRPVDPKQIAFLRRTNLQYYYISAKRNYNFEMPFLYLAWKLVGVGDFPTCVTPALAPREVQIDPFALYKYEADLDAAAAQPLHDDDGAFD